MLSKEEFANDKERHGWLTSTELNSMSTLLNKVVTGVKLHSKTRKKTFDHPQWKDDRRMTVMLTDKGSTHLADEDVDRATCKLPVPWTGMTVFYHDRPSYEEVSELYYIDTIEGLAPMEMTHEESLGQ